MDSGRHQPGSVLRDSLLFKGGTALKKCYFGDYRFSEDLDFTAVGSVPTGVAMESAIRDACATAVKLLHSVRTGRDRL